MRNSTEKLEIRRFEAQDQAAAKRLILAGMAEHWGLLDPNLNPDLNDIGASYADALFLVAWLGEKMVGTGALVARSDDGAGKPAVAEIVRMSVASDQRRLGIGNAILRRLCEEGKRLGFRRIILETNANWEGAVAFYQRFGFGVTHYEEGAFGRKVYFALDLR